MKPLRIFWRLFADDRLLEYADIVMDEVVFKSSLQTRTVDVKKAYQHSKMMTSLFKFLLAVVFAVSIASTAAMDDAAYYATGIMFVGFTVLFLGMGYSNSFYSVNLDYLFTLPLSRRDVFKIRTVAFFRYFDLPLILAFILFEIIVAVRSPIAAIPAAVSFWVSVVLFASLLALLGKKAAGMADTSRVGVVVRILTIAAWILCVYGSYFLFRFASYIASAARGYMSKLAPLFPFSFGLWISDPASLLYLLYCTPYIALSVISARWMVENLASPPSMGYMARGIWKIRTTGKIFAFIVKDVKVISRSLQLMTLTLMLLIEALFYVFMFPSPYTWIPAVLTLQILITLSAAAFMAADRSGYAEILPASRIEIALSKILCTTAIYVVSFSILSVVVLLRGGGLQILSLFPSAIAVILFTVLLSSESSNPFDASSVLAVFLALLLVFLPVCVGGIAALLFSKSFELYSFGVSTIEVIIAIVTLYKKFSKHL